MKRIRTGRPTQHPLPKLWMLPRGKQPSQPGLEVSDVQMATPVRGVITNPAQFRPGEGSRADYRTGQIGACA